LVKVFKNFVEFRKYEIKLNQMKIEEIEHDMDAFLKRIESGESLEITKGGQAFSRNKTN